MFYVICIRLTQIYYWIYTVILEVCDLFDTISIYLMFFKMQDIVNLISSRQLTRGIRLCFQPCMLAYTAGCHQCTNAHSCDLRMTPPFDFPLLADLCPGVTVERRASDQYGSQ